MKYKFFLSLFFLFSLFITSSVVVAGDPKLTIQDEGYAAKFISQSIPDPIQIQAGETKEVTLTFQNVGTKTWDSNSSNYISAYTVEPKYRASDFYHKSWISKSQTAKILGKVKPNEKGQLKITLQAPATPGEYVERFYLSAENKSWMKGSYFFMKIKVVAASKPITQAPTASPPKVVSTYSAKFLGLSKPRVSLQPGERVSILFMYQNAGNKAWESFSFKGNEQSLLAGSSLSFADESWKSPTLVKEGTIHIVKDGILQKNFTLKAPTIPGSYKASFYLEVDGQKVEGSDATVDVTVTSNAGDTTGEALPLVPVTPNPGPRLAAEPTIRVGLQKLEKEITFLSSEDEYDIYSGSNLVGRLPMEGSGTFSYGDGNYTCLCNGTTYNSSEFFRLVPVHNSRAVFQLRNFERTVPWQPGVNFNTYRGIFEIRIPKNGTAPYAIEEVGFEDYVSGIREVSNGTPMEYMKSQAILQRTYAYYIQQSTTKHDDRYFDVVANTGDQLYLGYESEKLMPRFLEAVAATRGMMVVYDTDKNPDTPRDIVITPYFGNSDGRTRSWKEVWGGKDEKPWLVSVPAVYDKRDKKKMYGHGVGMSQRDAMIKADEEKLDYTALIKYYYTGVEIEQIY